MEITAFLIKIVKILDHLKIPYAITGGMAVSVWGRVRTTADVDIIVEFTPEDISGLAKELLQFDKDVYVSEEAIAQALEHKGEFNFVDPNTGLKADFWVVKDYFNEQEIKRAIAKDFYGYNINFVCPEDLILSKLLWYKMTESTRQLEDIESVLSISEVNLEQVRDLAQKQGTLDILEILIKKAEEK
ncbi:MAG: hypothetical protein EXS48_02015 [Candidatus Staskawiczbacteria bacterium]|nr:hypothetical protein [Candidatus Staskawiczbacteria bacterium]